MALGARAGLTSLTFRERFGCRSPETDFFLNSLQDQENFYQTHFDYERFSKWKQNMSAESS